MRFADSPVLAPTFPPWRSRFVVALLAVAFGTLVGRALYLQGWNHDFLQAKGESRYSRTLEIPGNRGRIFDRNGEALAVSTPVKSIWAIPEDVALSTRELERLAQVLELPRDELRRRLGDTARDFVYLKRQVPPETADRIAALRIAGIHQSKEYRRYYPAGETMAHMLGFTDVDDAGQEGIELAFEAELAGQAGSRRVIKDRLGRIVEDMEGAREARDGADVTLALDSRIQNLAYVELKRAVEAQPREGRRHRGRGRHHRRSARAREPALLQPEQPRHGSSGGQVRNRAVTDAFEPGSTLKPFTVALALDTGRVSPDTMIQIAPGSLTIGAATIRDAHPEKSLTVEQVIQKSSNVGAAKIALALAPETMWGLFDGVGFGAAAAARLSRRGGRQGPAVQDLAADRAGDDVLRPRHRGEPGAARARLHRVRARRRPRAAFARAGRLAAGRQAGGIEADGRDRPPHARAGGAAGRHCAARADHGLSRRRARPVPRTSRSTAATRPTSTTRRSSASRRRRGRAS